jgi:hypothetical protein
MKEREDISGRDYARGAMGEERLLREVKEERREEKKEKS